ncbi:MAG: PKD domain-containing protein [Paludibacteraceae bacterium]|nr:PKD domain-containing protein [Paludibacteraceae bacterium]
MKNKTLFLIGMMVLALVGCKDREVTFSYKPETPKAGETIRFSNTTQEGEEWAWSFGDGTTSASKSPSKVYKRPGQYTVTLKVDDKRTRTRAVTITVVDTVPTIGISDTIVNYYQPVELTALFYNPFGHKFNYQWTLPEGTLIIKGAIDEKSLTVCFTQPEVSAPIGLKLSDEVQSQNIDTTIYIHDYPATSLLIGRTGEVLRQRIYDYGYEQATAWSIPQEWVIAPAAMYVMNNQLIVFNSSSLFTNLISQYDLTDGSVRELVHYQGGAGKFRNGCVYNQSLYWTEWDAIYSTSLQGYNRPFTASPSSPMYVASASDLGLPPDHEPGGLLVYNGHLLLAYGNGLHRFVINGQQLEPLSTLLPEYQITSLAHDPMAKKLYFTTANGLYVANFADGSNVRLIDPHANGKGLTISNADNRLFWTTDQGVFCQPLVQSPNNNHNFEALQVNTLTDIIGLGFDQVSR